MGPSETGSGRPGLAGLARATGPWWRQPPFPLT